MPKFSGMLMIINSILFEKMAKRTPNMEKEIKINTPNVKFASVPFNRKEKIILMRTASNESMPNTLLCFNF